jgi:hypothetical protein
VHFDASWLLTLLRSCTKLPQGLTLLHEHSDHFSLQNTTPMKLDGIFRLIFFEASHWFKFQSVCTAQHGFLWENSVVMDKEQFDALLHSETTTTRVAV